MMQRTMSVMDAMTQTPVLIGPMTSLSECAKKMIEGKVGSLLVEENKTLKGIVTEKDMVQAIAKEFDLKKVRVTEVMSEGVITIEPQRDLLEAIRIMSKKEVRRLPVVTKEGRLLGLLTVSDILRVEPQLLEIVFEKNLISRSGKYAEGKCESCGMVTQIKSVERKLICVDCDEKAY